MVTRRSAGVLLYRNSAEATQVLLGHMGGPYWARRDTGAWSIPKGEHGPDESPFDAARREFTEELGLPVPVGEFRELGEIRQRGGKTVTAWAVHADLEPAAIRPGTFEMEFPPGSGVRRTYPELDRVAWFDFAGARARIVAAQREFLDRLWESLAE